MKTAKRGRAAFVCAWCKAPLSDGPTNKTLGEFTDYGPLPTGVGVAVCSEKCPKRPEGAPVGAEFK